MCSVGDVPLRTIHLQKRRLLPRNSLLFSFSGMQAALSIQQPKLDRILDLPELLNQLPAIGCFHVGYGIANAMARHQELRYDIDLVLRKHLVNLCHDAWHVFMYMDEAMGFVYLGEDQVREISAHIGVALVDKLGHTPGDKFGIAFLAFFIIKHHDAFLVSQVAIQPSFAVAQVTDGLELVCLPQLLAVEFLA